MARNCPMGYGCGVPEDMSHDGHLRHHKRMLRRFRRWRQLHVAVAVAVTVMLLALPLSDEGRAFIGIMVGGAWCFAGAYVWFSDDREKQQLAVEYLTEKWVREHVDG